MASLPSLVSSTSAASTPSVAQRSPRAARLAASAPALDGASYALLGSSPAAPPAPPTASTALTAAAAAAGALAVEVSSSSSSSSSPALLPPPSAQSPPAAAPLRRRALQAALTTACVLGYGVSLYVNGLSGRSLSPAAGLVLLGSVRGLFQVALCGAMLLSGAAPPEFLPGGAGGRPLSWRALVPALVGIWANAGFMPYAALVEGGEVSVLAPMCGIYSLVPILFGLLVMREARGWRKLLGIALSLASVLLLAFSGSGFAGAAPSPAVVAEKALLFLLVIASWGGGDCMAAYLGRSLSTFEIAASNAVGQFATAALFGLVAIASGSFSGGGSGGGGGGGVGALSFVGASVVANVLGIIAWLSFTRLGETEGASDFTPVVALYVYIPVLLGAVLLGEDILSSPGKVGGLVCAGAAAVLLSLK